MTTEEDIRKKWYWFFMFRIPFKIGRIIGVIIGVPIIFIASVFAGIINDETLEQEAMFKTLKSLSGELK